MASRAFSIALASNLAGLQLLTPYSHPARSGSAGAGRLTQWAPMFAAKCMSQLQALRWGWERVRKTQSGRRGEDQVRAATPVWARPSQVPGKGGQGGSEHPDRAGESAGIQFQEGAVSILWLQLTL